MALIHRARAYIKLALLHHLAGLDRGVGAHIYGHYQSRLIIYRHLGVIGLLEAL